MGKLDVLYVNCVTDRRRKFYIHIGLLQEGKGRSGYTVNQLLKDEANGKIYIVNSEWSTYEARGKPFCDRKVSILLIFNSINFFQQPEIPMSSPLSPVVVDIFMKYFETVAPKSSSHNRNRSKFTLFTAFNIKYSIENIYNNISKKSYKIYKFHEKRWWG